MKPEAFNLLLALVLEEQASEEELTQFREALQNDPVLQKEASLQFSLHAQIGIAIEEESTSTAFVTHTLTEINNVDSELFTKRVTAQLRKQRFLKKVSAIAALLLLGLFFTFLFSIHQISEKSLNTLAFITRVDGAQWSNTVLHENDTITQGQSVKIESGLVEIDLAGRGTLVIEGPAHLDFISPMEVMLHHGSVVMRATKKGQGYTIQTSQGKIIDIGTEFAVSAKQNTVETHVIEGSVEAIANNGESFTLKGNDALSFNHTGSQNIASDTGRFYTKLPPVHQTLNYLHWSFDENAGSVALANGELDKGTKQVGDLVLKSAEGTHTPQWSEGVKRSGIYFEGTDSYAEAEYKGIQGGKARTVCCWIKVPEDFSPLQGFGIISWGNPKEIGETWQISVNPWKRDGQVGRLRLGLQGSQIIGSTDLRDGQWHHIAVVFYGSSKPSIGTHALLYVDGQKESVSRAALKEVKTKTESDGHGVWVGRNVTHRNNHIASPYKFFRGSIDELYIFDGALTQNELSQLITLEKIVTK